TPHTHSYTPSLHDALPISARGRARNRAGDSAPGRVEAAESALAVGFHVAGQEPAPAAPLPSRWKDGLSRREPPVDGERPHGKRRSEEHTSELQSRGHLVCR